MACDYRGGSADHLVLLGDSSALVPQIKAAGGKVMQTVGPAKAAVTARESGADVIVAQGWEAGGHVWCTVATMPLVPIVVETVELVPVVAAGGIADTAWPPPCASAPRGRGSAHGFSRARRSRSIRITNGASSKRRRMKPCT
jgi:hypothetical protein